MARPVGHETQLSDELLEFDDPKVGVSGMSPVPMQMSITMTIPAALSEDAEVDDEEWNAIKAQMAAQGFIDGSDPFEVASAGHASTQSADASGSSGSSAGMVIDDSDLSDDTSDFGSGKPKTTRSSVKKKGSKSSKKRRMKTASKAMTPTRKSSGYEFKRTQSASTLKLSGSRQSGSMSTRPQRKRKKGSKRREVQTPTLTLGSPFAMEASDGDASPNFEFPGTPSSKTGTGGSRGSSSSSSGGGSAGGGGASSVSTPTSSSSLAHTTIGKQDRKLVAENRKLSLKCSHLEVQVKKLDTQRRALEIEVGRLKAREESKSRTASKEKSMRIRANQERYEMQRVLSQMQRTIQSRLKLLGIDFNDCANVGEALDMSLKALKELMQQLEKKDEEMKDIELKYENQKEETEKINDENQSFRRMIKFLNEKLNELKKLLNMRDKELNELKLQNKQMMDDNKHLKKINMELNDKLQRSEHDIHRAKECIQLLEKEKLIYQSDLKEKNGRIMDLEFELETLKQSLTEKHGTLGELSSVISDKNQLINDLRKELNSTEQLLNEKKLNNDHLLNELNLLNEKYHKLNDNCKQLTKEKLELNKELTKYQSKLLDKSQELQINKEEIVELKDLLSKLKKDKLLLKQRIYNLEVNLTEKDTQLDSVIFERDEWKDLLINANNYIQLLISSATSLNDQNIANNKILLITEEKLITQTKENTSLISKLNQYQLKYENTSLLLSDSLTYIDLLIKSNLNLSNRLAESNHIIDDLHQKLNILQIKYDDKSQLQSNSMLYIDLLIKTNISFNNRLIKMTKERDSFKHEMIDYQRINQDNQKYIQLLIQMSHQLSNQLNSITKKFDVLSNQSVDLDQRVKELETQVKTLKKHIEKVEQNNDDIQLENKKLRNDIQDLLKSAAMFMMDKNNHSGEVKCLKSSPNRPIIATCATDKTVRLWNVNEDESKPGKIKCNPYARSNFRGTPLCLAWNSTGELLACGSAYLDTPDGFVLVWQIDSDDDCNAKCRSALRSKPALRFGEVNAVCFGPSNTPSSLSSSSSSSSKKKSGSVFDSESRMVELLYAGDKAGSIWIFNVENENLIGKINAHSDIVYDIGIGNNLLLYSVSHDKTLVCVDTSQINVNVEVKAFVSMSEIMRRDIKKKEPERFRRSRTRTGSVGSAGRRTGSVDINSSRSSSKKKSRRQQVSRQSSSRDLTSSSGSGSGSGVLSALASAGMSPGVSDLGILSDGIITDEMPVYFGKECFSDIAYPLWKVGVSEDGSVVCVGSRRLSQALPTSVSFPDTEADHINGLEMKGGLICVTRMNVGCVKLFDMRGTIVKKFDSRKKTAMKGCDFMFDDEHLVTIAQDSAKKSPIMQAFKYR